ncbi:hypothetical protein ACIGO9_29630 [Nocardia asteroides]|uniref:hypothetical protein n=1 Tax=Nocardia asteroides TaxID=1824 RepID=UPI0037CAEECC
MTRWGKAGQRLTEAEFEQRIRQRRAAREASRAHEEVAAPEREAEGKRLWAAGLLVPAAITVALDRKELYGPEVDRACGAEEPAVDHWEAGILYPTWEQTRLLAQLCDVAVAMLCQDIEPIRPLCAKARGHDDDPPSVMRFLPEAIAATLRPELFS